MKRWWEYCKEKVTAHVKQCSRSHAEQPLERWTVSSNHVSLVSFDSANSETLMSVQSPLCVSTLSLLSNLTEGDLTWRSAIFLMHVALEIPIAVQGVYTPSNLPFLQLNNTAVVILKVGCNLPEYVLDRRNNLCCLFSYTKSSSMPR